MPRIATSQVKAPGMQQAIVPYRAKKAGTPETGYSSTSSVRAALIGGIIHCPDPVVINSCWLNRKIMPGSLLVWRDAQSLPLSYRNINLEFKISAYQPDADKY